MPAGSPVTWYSSDDTVSIVNNGTVTAIAAGTATITGTITVEGVDYSDTCEISVEAVPVSNVVFDFTDPDNWNNPELWNKQQFQEDTRSTYIEYDSSLEELKCIYNPNGTTTTLYADISPLVGEFVYEDSYNYFLEIEYSNGGGSYRFTHAGTNACIFAFDSSVPEFIPNTYDSDTELIPLSAYNVGVSRLITIQIRKGDNTDADTPLAFKARIIREPKA